MVGVLPQRPSTSLGPSGLVPAQGAVEGWSLPAASFDGVHPEPVEGLGSSSLAPLRMTLIEGLGPKTSKHPACPGRP